MRHFLRRGMLAAALILAAASVRQLSIATAQSSGQATLVGVVVPRDAAPGETVSGSVVADPQNYQQIPGLRVVLTPVPAEKSAGEQPTGQASLQGVVVDLGDGRKQPADRPLVVKLPPGAASFAVSVFPRDGGPALARESVPLSSTRAPALSQCSMPSVSAPGATQVIHGPTSGNADSLRVTVDGQPARILAASPRSVFWKVPGDLSEGPHTVTLTDGGRQVKLPLYLLGLEMKADNPHLVKGQSTPIHVVVSGLESLPAEAWERGAPPADLVDLHALAAHFPELKNPPADEPGAVLLLIENRSPQVVRMGKRDVIALRLRRQDFAQGPYVHNDVLKSLRSGDFHIDSTVVACLKSDSAPAGNQAQNVSNDEGLPGPPPTTTSDYAKARKEAEEAARDAAQPGLSDEERERRKTVEKEKKAKAEELKKNLPAANLADLDEREAKQYRGEADGYREQEKLIEDDLNFWKHEAEYWREAAKRAKTPQDKKRCQDAAKNAQGPADRYQKQMDDLKAKEKAADDRADARAKEAQQIRDAESKGEGSKPPL